MKRITLNLDLEDNEVFSKEVENVIRSTVEHKYKGYVDSIVDNTINDRICKRIDEWKNSSWSRRAKIDAAIDAEIQKGIKIPELNKEEVMKFLDGKIKDRETLFEYSRALNEKNLKEYIDERIDSYVKDFISSKILEAVFNKNN